MFTIIHILCILGADLMKTLVALLLEAERPFI